MYVETAASAKPNTPASVETHQRPVASENPRAKKRGTATASTAKRAFFGRAAKAIMITNALNVKKKMARVWAAPAGSARNMSESMSQVAAKLAMRVAATVSRSLNARMATMICNTNAGRTT